MVAAATDNGHPVQSHCVSVELVVDKSLPGHRGWLRIEHMFGSMEGAEAGAAGQAATPVTVSSTGSDKAGKATADVATDVTTTVTA